MTGARKAQKEQFKTRILLMKLLNDHYILAEGFRRPSSLSSSSRTRLGRSSCLQGLKHAKTVFVRRENMRTWKVAPEVPSILVSLTLRLIRSLFRVQKHHYNSFWKRTVIRLLEKHFNQLIFFFIAVGDVFLLVRVLPKFMTRYAINLRLRSNWIHLEVFFGFHVLPRMEILVVRSSRLVLSWYFDIKWCELVDDGYIGNWEQTKAIKNNETLIIYYFTESSLLEPGEITCAVEHDGIISTTKFISALLITTGWYATRTFISQNDLYAVMTICDCTDSCVMASHD